MAQLYDFGMIGLGVMGSNLLLNLADHRFKVAGFDVKAERGAALEAAAKEGTIVKGFNTLPEMVLALEKPRRIMMLVPAGGPVDDVIASLLPLLDKGDIVIDGGNSYFKDTLHRNNYLQEKGIHFMGMGVSGGELGARLGPSMMPGGDKEAYQYLKPLLEAIAAKADGVPCVAHMGKGAAGHYVKMVHNGIEYAMMQLIGEVYDILKRGGGFSNSELHTLFKQWNKGALQSFLINITAEIFKTGDDQSNKQNEYLVDKILDQAGAKGTGKWTSQEAMNLPTPIPTIDAAVTARNLSVYKEERVQAAALYKPKISKLPMSKEELAEEVEKTLLFAFVISYAQGLAMLAKASEEHGMDIPLPAVVQVWKAGCIIRSSLLQTFEKAFAKNDTLPNLLLDGDIATLLQEAEGSLRKVVAAAVEAKIPTAALSSALAYFDAYSTERLPINLVQAQRDYFGAHTYQRIDMPGVFHTEWHQ